ncbi:MAG: DinB family protein [Pseudomonadota bacterium]
MQATLCHDNIDCLERMGRLIQRLTDAQYVASQTPCVNGIGAHVRHILDHFDAFMSGLETGSVDYDARQRDKDTECQRTVALARNQTIKKRLHNLTAHALPESLSVCMDCGSTASSRLATTSNALRELQFLVSHTVHHDALIAAAVVAMDVTPEAGYGIAPSTLRHQRKRA